MVREALEARFGTPASARLDWKPQVLVPISDELTAQSLMKFLEVLEDNDDVQRVQANFDIAADVLEKLA